MDIASVVLNQLIIMACLIFVGYICSKTKLISLNGVGQLSNLLLNVVVPCVILKSFMIEFNTQKLITFAIACFFGFLAHFVMLLIASILYKKTNGDEYKVKRFALIFSNCGFMAIPIISAVLGNEGVFYSSAFLIANNTLTFSYGVFILNSQEKSTFKSSVIKILLNPAIISVLVGFVIFICQIPIPGFLSSTASFFEGMNTPLAMVIMGVYICHTNLKKAFGNKKIYLISFFRLIIAPLIMILSFFLFNLVFPNILDDKIIIANLIAAACPCAITTLILSAVYLKDVKCRDLSLFCVVITTILSLFTIPLMIFISQRIFGF